MVFIVILSGFRQCKKSKQINNFINLKRIIMVCSVNAQGISRYCIKIDKGQLFLSFKNTIFQLCLFHSLFINTLLFGLTIPLSKVFSLEAFKRIFLGIEYFGQTQSKISNIKKSFQFTLIHHYKLRKLCFQPKTGIHNFTSAQVQDFILQLYNKKLMKYFSLICLFVIHIASQTCSLTNTCSNPLQKWDKKICACRCIPPKCELGYRQNLDTCLCVKINSNCSTNKVWDSAAQACKCSSNNCVAPQIQDLVTCQCVSQSCPPNQNWDSRTSSCRCAPIACDSDQIQNTNTCLCDYLPVPHPECTAIGKEWDYDLSKCRCPPPTNCTSLQVQDLNTCLCKCITQPCTSDQKWDDANCVCIPRPGPA